MKILGHIHTFNDEEVIDRSLQALLDQTYPLDAIVIVDNASTDGSVDKLSQYNARLRLFRETENKWLKALQQLYRVENLLTCIWKGSKLHAVNY